MNQRATNMSDSSHTLRPGKPEASAVVWDWQQETAPAIAHGDRRTKGTLQGVIGLTVGTLLFWFVSEHMGMFVWTVASLITLCALASPNGAYVAIERFIDWLVVVVGKAVTVLVMIPIFYLVFLPFGTLFRRGKKDTMTRFYEESAGSYWLTRTHEVTPEDRERLF
jgi:hypothetical protein